MGSRCDALGRHLAELRTPALVLDLDAFERNCASIAGSLGAAGVNWRPHIKAVKSPRLARTMIESGAIGVTCAKVDEAEVMIANGIGNVLVANQPSNIAAWSRLARLNRITWLAACVDHTDQLAAASAAAADHDIEVPVLIEVSVGLDRAGVRTAKDAVALARVVDRTPGVTLAGLTGYEGHLLTVKPEQRKQAEITTALNQLIAAKDAIEQDGTAVGIVSCGGTGSYLISSQIDGVTEIQAGGGVLMDEFYRHECGVDLEQALFVLASVASNPAPDRAVLDVGWKAVSDRLRLPVCRDRPDLAVAQIYAEHLRVQSDDARDTGLAYLDHVTLIPGYSDATTVLHDSFLAVRDGTVVEIIELLARGGMR